MAWLVVPAQLTTTLEAVNSLISTLGEAPVTSISPPPTSEVEEALARLNEVDLEVQSRGWIWNRESAYPLPLSTDGTVPLPDQCLRVTNAYWQGQPDGVIDIVQRGPQLYDRTNHTYTFKASPMVDMIVRLDWDATPQAHRSYVTLLACQRFHARKQASQVVLQINGQDLARAQAVAEQQEDEVAQYNSIDGNSGVVSGLYGLAGMRRNRAGY